MSITITRIARNVPDLPYEKIKNSIVGTSYILSLTFIGETRATRLNQTHRNASYTPNVLSFPLSEHAGEIYITPTVARREAHKFNMSINGYIGYLFIHGLLHLKGHHHGATMERAEKKYLARFSLA